MKLARRKCNGSHELPGPTVEGAAPHCAMHHEATSVYISGNHKIILETTAIVRQRIVVD